MSNSKQLFLTQTNEGELTEIRINVKNKATGCDGIHLRTLKPAVAYLVLVLTAIIFRVMVEGICPKTF